MAKNCIEAVSNILNHKVNMLNEEGLIQIWNIIVNNVCENISVKGTKYRSGQVYVGKHIPVDASNIEKYMDILYEYINNINEDVLIKASIVHFYFVYIHPFCDGNGRAARMLLSDYLYNNGYNRM